MKGHADGDILLMDEFLQHFDKISTGQELVDRTGYRKLSQGKRHRKLEPPGGASDSQ